MVVEGAVRMRKMVKRWLRKTIVACLIAAMLVGVMPGDMLQVEMGKVEAASYSSDYRYWSQGASDDSGMRKYGCWVVAQSKLIYETNINRSSSFNPDTYLQWQKDNGYINSGYWQTNGGQAPVAYAAQLGKELTYLGYWDASSDQLWFNINAGYYTILTVNNGDHYIMLANELSKEKGELYCYDSSSSVTSFSPRALSHYSTINGGHVYQYNQGSTGGGETVVNNPSFFYNTGVTDVTTTTAKINSSFSSVQTVTALGFYYGTSPDNMTKVVESSSTSTRAITVYYTLGDGKWCGALSPGTTYYYKIYAVVGGITYETSVDSFTTGGSVPDTQAPIISNIQVTNISSTGYTVSCTVTDNVGVASVTFPTWTEANGQDDLASTWPGPTSVNGSTYTYRVNISDHNNEKGVYFTHIWASDAAGNNSSEAASATIDGEAPVVVNVFVTDANNTGYTVTATVSDNIGIKRVWFPSKRSDQVGDEAWIWYKGTQNADGTYSARINATDFESVDGWYITWVYVYDTFDNVSEGYGFRQYVDTTPPVISDAKITSVDGGGYTVECTVTDNKGINRVQFPTWTDANGQDDLLENWDVQPQASGTANGKVYTFRVKDIDHNYERGRYVTHIYAFDKAGNVSKYETELSCDLQNKGVPAAEGTYNGHTYQFVDDRMTWQEAKATCEAMGGHLATITSAEEQQAIESFLPVEISSLGYFIGGYTVVGQPAWITGEKFEYTNWYPGEPSGKNDVEVEDVYHIYPQYNDAAITGKWNDVASDAPGYGYICEFEPIEITGITLSKSEIEVGVDKTVTLEATVSPAEGYHPSITWTSANTSVATVSDGVVTGVGAGTTTITAECGGKTATCKVTVVKPFESITMNLTDKTLFKNETCTLEVSYAPSDANASKDLEWSSANPNIATVSDEGVVTAVSAGSTTITATLKQNSQIKATCTVQVESYVVTFDTRGGSSIPSVELGKNENLSVQEPTKAGYAFTGWYKDAECTIPWDMENDVVNDNITLYAGWMEYHEGLWIVNIPAQKYTGSAIKPAVEVYHYATKLTEGSDYKISYKNNKDVADKSSAKAPSVIVTGKGNYTGKETATFTISAKNLTDEDITADDIFLASNGKVQKPIPVVTWNGKKLKNNKDYAVAYPAATAGAYRNNGSYKVRIVGKGNFTGERTIQLHITGSNLISKAKVSKIAAQQYTGKEIQPEFTVKYGSVTLTKGIDYTVSYENNISAGTARAVITGIGSYVGEKKVAFKITGLPISKAKVNKLPETVVYNGAAQKVKYELQMDVGGKAKTLVEGKDYEVSYKNNTSAGTATIQFTGINGYSGVLKKTFKILPYDIGKNKTNKLTVSYNQTVAYMKDSTTMEPKVVCFGKTLKLGKDYTLSYKNNKQISEGVATDKLPTVTITGKGNYSGSITRTYKITKQDISLLNMTAADKVYQSKAGKCLSAPVIKDVNGKKLTAGKDYEKNVVYTYTSSTKLADGTVRSAGSVVEASDILPAGATIAVTTKGIGNYTGEISCTYRIVRADISKAKATVKAQVYTGKAIEPGKSDITLKVGKTTLSSGDYEIVSYSNNVRKGTATVVVQGKGNYGGTKTIKFKIKSKVFSWWWR